MVGSGIGLSGCVLGTAKNCLSQPCLVKNLISYGIFLLIILLTKKSLLNRMVARVWTAVALIIVFVR